MQRGHVICSRLPSTSGSVDRVVAMNCAPLGCIPRCLTMPYLSVREPDLSPWYSVFLEESNCPLGAVVATLGLSQKVEWFILTEIDTSSGYVLAFSVCRISALPLSRDSQNAWSTDMHPTRDLTLQRRSGTWPWVHWSYHILHCPPSRRNWPRKALEWPSEGKPETLA